MKPYLMVSMSQDNADKVPNTGTNLYYSIDGYGFSAAILRTIDGGTKRYTSCDITCSVPGNYIISSSETSWNQTWNVSSVPATKTLKVEYLCNKVAVSIYPA